MTTLATRLGRTIIFSAFVAGAVACSEQTPEVETAAYRIQVAPKNAVLLPNAELQLKAQVFDPANNLVFNHKSRPVVVRWKSSNPDIASIDERGIVTVHQEKPVDITAELEESAFLAEADAPTETGQAQVNAVAAPSEVNDLQAIFVAPERIAIDLGETRTLSVTAVDGQGAPTTLDCGGDPTLGTAEPIDAAYDGSLGAEAIEATGVRKGFSLLTLDCAGYQASPVVVEVKPSVTIPDPSPSTQDSDFGLEPSVALVDEVIHLATYDAQHHKLVYTRFDGIWTSQFIDGEGDYGRHAKILLDPITSRPLICALEGLGISCWSQDDEGFWTRESIDTNVVDPGQAYDYPLSGAMDDAGRAFIVYHRATNDTLVLAQRDPSLGLWVTEVIASGADFGSVAVASDGEPRVAFRQNGAARFGHRACIGAGWSFEDIDLENLLPGANGASPGTFVKLAVGADDRPQIVYFKGGNLIHGIKTNGQWRTNVIEAVELTGPYFGFALDRRMRPRVSYFDATEGRMRYAHRRDGRWYVDNPTASAGVGTHTSIAVDDYDRAQIPYYDYPRREAGYYVEPHYLDYESAPTITQDPRRANTNECLGLHD